MNHVSDLAKALPNSDSVYTQDVVHVEVCQNSFSTESKSVIKDAVTTLLQKREAIFGNGTLTEFEEPFLQEHVEWISISDIDTKKKGKCRDLDTSKLQIYVIQLHGDTPGTEEIDEEGLPAASHWIMPAVEFSGLWDSLIFDEDIKGKLLRYAMTTLLFADKNVNPNVISWNKVVLLHGPPGTGKTSLCKALAQKLCIRLSNRYSYGQLIEINSHSLFSKWFSESGKLVMKMFQKIQELIDDTDSIVCVLIDEVESLTSARKNAMSGSEPSDAIRVVNALLTQLDQIKRYPNVMILTTSNITGAIDLAFIDRADIKQYIGLPTPAAIFQIYHSCINELIKTGIVYPAPAHRILDLHSLEMMNFVENEVTFLSLRLRDVAVKSEGLSGRTLRKLPFIAHAVFIHEQFVPLEVFLKALCQAVSEQFRERELLSKDS